MGFNSYASGMTNRAPSRTLSTEKAEIRFAEPFRISGYTFDAMRSIVVRITQGLDLGRGEAAGIYYFGDDQERMLETIDAVNGAVEDGLTREELQVLLPPCGARNALDCALG